MQDDLETALEHDRRIREQVAKLKAKNPQLASIPVPPDRMAKIAEAQRLRTQLGGFSSMPPEVRGNPEVRRELWPKVADYVRLRLELAAQATCDALVAELRLSPEEMSQAIGVAASVQEVARSAPPSLEDRVAALEEKVQRLERRQFDTSDVPPLTSK